MARILVVDDDPDIVEATTVVLEGQGHEVVSADNRSDGMTAVQEKAPDLLILDVMMEQPDDGIAMAQALRRQGCKKPILMLSAVGKVTGMDYGKDSELIPVDDYVEKPVDPAVLVEKINALLGQ